MSNERGGETAVQTALVTGGASGIGAATARRFLARGWNVMIADMNPGATSEFIGEAPVEARVRLRACEIDVTEEPAVEQAMKATVEWTGRLDCVVNCAGIGGAFGAITEIEVEDWDETFAVLVRGVFLGTKHGARLMQGLGGGGTIVNVASLAGLAGGIGPQAYSAAKAAVINLTRLCAVELAPERIRVNAVCPGVIDTPLVATGKVALAPALEEIQPWPDVGQPDDVARVIEFLAGGESNFITGEAIVVDGGLLAAGPRLNDAIGGDPSQRGLVGINLGTTGRKSTIRRRVQAEDPSMSSAQVGKEDR